MTYLEYNFNENNDREEARKSLENLVLSMAQNHYNKNNLIIEREENYMRIRNCRVKEEYNPITFRHIQKMKTVAVSFIDEDYSLIRYLCEQTEERDISKNNGYIYIKREDGSATTLGRFILEYYANFDIKLYTILSNVAYEINHKNKLREDNTLENLELVTKNGNLLHRENKPYEDEIVMTSAELQEIQKKLMQREEYNKDKEFIKRKSGLFVKGIKENKVTDTIIK